MHADVHAAWALSQSGTQPFPALIHALRHSTALTVLSLSCLCRLGTNRSVPLARTLSARPPLLGPFRLGHPRDRNHRVGPFGSDPSASASLARSLNSVLSCGPLGLVPSARSLDSIVSLGPLGSVSPGPAPSDRPPPSPESALLVIWSSAALVLGTWPLWPLRGLLRSSVTSVVDRVGLRSLRSSVASIVDRAGRRSLRSSVASILCRFGRWSLRLSTASASQLGHSAAATGARPNQASLLALVHARRRCALRRSIESCAWPLSVLGAGSIWHLAAIGRLNTHCRSRLGHLPALGPSYIECSPLLRCFGAWPL